MRTDADRRHRLRLAKLSGEAGRLAHERDRLRHELAGIVTAPGGRGWNEPKAHELSAQIRAIDADWQRVLEEIRNHRSQVDVAA